MLELCKHCGHEIRKDKVGVAHYIKYEKTTGGYCSKKCKCGCIKPEKR